MDIKHADQFETIPMPDAHFANLLFIEPCFNGTLATMMFDTGASKTVLRQSFIEQIGAEISNEVITGGNSAGQTLQARSACISEIRLGNFLITNISVVVFPDNAFDFGEDENGNRFTAQGFLGWDVISQFRWEINPIHREYRFGMSTPRRGSNNLTWDSFPLIKAYWGNEEILLGFDCGHTGTMLDSTWLTKIPNIRFETNSITGLGGSTVEESGIVDGFEIRVGSKILRMNNITVVKRAIFGSGDRGMVGLLGADAVQNRKWTIDPGNHHFEIID